MAPVGPVVHQNVATKAKRPIPPGIQTNGVISSSKSSPSPSMSAKKPPPSAKQPPHSASERAITASTVRPINRARRETASQLAGRHSRNSAGLRSASMAAETTPHDAEPPPYVVTDSYILKKFAGRPPSLIIHMHPTHFRFDNQDGMFPYKSPMKLFLDHLRSRTVPHDLLQYLTDAGVPFYEGCLIVQVHDHKSVAQAKDVSKPTPPKGSVVPSSIHNYNQYLTPSPFVPFPKESLSSDGNVKGGDSKDKPAEEKSKESTVAAPAPEDVKGKTTKPKVFTVVLHPTALSLQMDLLIKGSTPKDSDGISAIPPPTPMSIVPPTPTATSMPPPAKRQKREKTELDGSNIHAAEGQILLATTAPLMLEPTKNIEETIVLLEAMSHPKHSEAPPQPKTRKRTVAEVAADEAAAAEEERYMLFGDERLSSSVAGAQNGGAADGDASGGATFEPRFERFKVLADIKREHAEKKEQEKLKQQENDRRLQQQRQQQQQEAVVLAQRQAAEQERTRREAAAREAQLRQAEAQRQAQARAAASTPSNQNNARSNTAQPQHAHPQNNTMANGVTNAVNGATQNAVANNPQNQAQPQAQAQPRFQAQITQPPASSPAARQGTPQNMSSPMVASVPMQQTNSGMAVSPPRPASVVQNAPMSVPMAHNMSSRGSQQSHPSGTPRIPHSTPNISHGTPINRPAMTSTPRMTQASPPPNMMAQNSQMGQAMMMNNQNMNQANQQAIAQVAAHQRAIAQQQHMAAMQNGVNNGNMSGNMSSNMNGQMSPQQQQQMMQMMQRQLMLQQQAQQSQGQHQQAQQGNMMTQQLAQQYAQQIQNMSGNQMRQMTPQMQAQFQQMMRMQQVNGQMGNNMQGQVNGQMMNGNNVNMQALQAMQQQQAQRQAQAQQAQQQQQQQNQQQPQQGQQQMGNNPIQTQIQHNARVIYHQLLQQAILKHGSQDRIPAEINEKLKQTSISRAQNLFQQGMIQRRNQQQLMMQQQQQQQMQQMQQQQMQQQQLQQQQMQQMQGMNNMMGPQGGM
ncbi:hypothetical protein NCS55_00023300 [Fusarium keratoplasticum]|nr:hypothetical protein NCS55_00023300 [Fusarium keratoplasticum]